VLFRAVLAGPPLLPRAAAPVANDSALSVEVTAPGGASVFRAGPSAYDAIAESLGTQYGGLVARVATRPDAAARFVIGGLPRLPVVSLAGAFLLSAGLLAVALLQLRREAELARLREDFVAGVSHELRTPLAQIRLFAETLSMGRARSDPERQRALAIIQAEAQRLSQMVDNLLQFSRASRPARTLAIERIEVAPLVRDVAEGFAPLAAARGVRLDLAFVNGGVVRADRDALRQVLLNLFDNTLKHGPDGQTVTVRIESAVGAVRVTVDDEGRGIAEQDRDRVFERFVRLAAARATTGAGLGLAVVRELTTRMGGRAWAEASPGRGARFVVELPEGGA
jgi:signal transduction histidine kinase